ncbi:MAG: photosystem I reaction center subunit XII [Symploca sp. SIO2E9]|nr:photosystem I reaction center subunit XII [Symploca sp. SIO2E9]
MGNLAQSATLGLDACEVDPLELRPYATEDDLQTVIRAVYKQVLGNEHLMDSQRLYSAEALLRDSDITVRGFVGLVAKSELYQSLFFLSSSQNRFIEVNFKHLLGRPPQDQAEIIEHVCIYKEGGYEAEIDSYIDSDEYYQNFGEYVVPYPRAIISQTGIKNEGFNRMFSLLRGPATSDRSKEAKLIPSLAANMATPIKPSAVGNGAAYANTGKRFKITYSTSAKQAQLSKFSKRECLIDYKQMPQQLKSIHRTGGKILSIDEDL